MRSLLVGFLLFITISAAQAQWQPLRKKEFQFPTGNSTIEFDEDARAREQRQRERNRKENARREEERRKYQQELKASQDRIKANEEARRAFARKRAAEVARWQESNRAWDREIVRRIQSGNHSRNGPTRGGRDREI